VTQSNHSTNKKNWERFQVNVRILNPKILKWSATPCFNQRPRVKHHVCSERMSNAARFLRTRRGFNLSVYCLRYRVFGMLKVTCSSCATLCSHALHLLKTVFRVFFRSDCVCCVCAADVDVSCARFMTNRIFCVATVRAIAGYYRRKYFS